jgi:transposase
VAQTIACTAANANGLSGPRCPGCQERDITISKLQQQVASLRQGNKQLKAQLEQEQERRGRNSSNSSRPPSSDPPDAPKPKTAKKPSGRQRGGQPGHPPTNPGLIPLEELTEPPIACIPNKCQHCQATLSGHDDMPTCHQVIELPPLVPEVREYQRHLLFCDRCGKSTHGPLPDGVPEAGYGPRLQAFIGLCTGCYHLSKRQVEELLTTAFNIPICLGSIANIEQRVSAALAAPVAEAKQHLQQADHVHADETSWPQQPSKGWLWVGVTAYLAIFSVRRKRDRNSLHDLLGPQFPGVLISDRYSAYHGVKRRQFCWAHLRRDWQAFIDRGGSSQRIGQQLLRQTDEMFHLWHRVRDGTLSPESFTVAMISIRYYIDACLREGARCTHSRTAGTCTEILQQQSALWTFLYVGGVEPTNNAAERALRQAVLWRKKSFGTRSSKGSCYVERILTTVGSCRLQGRNVLEYLTSVCLAAAHDQPAPSLLPKKTR